MQKRRAAEKEKMKEDQQASAKASKEAADIASKTVSP